MKETFLHRYMHLNFNNTTYATVVSYPYHLDTLYLDDLEAYVQSCLDILPSAIQEFLIPVSYMVTTTDHTNSTHMITFALNPKASCLDLLENEEFSSILHQEMDKAFGDAFEDDPQQEGRPSIQITHNQVTVTVIMI